MKLNLSKFELTNRVALITGGAGLLGIQHAVALLDSGANVVITDLNIEALIKVSDKLINQYGANRIITKTMDVTSLSDIKRVEKELCAEGIYIDILVNNAAIDPKVGDSVSLSESSRVENFPIQTWDLQIKVGLTGAFLCSQIFGTKMASKKGGVILNIASDLSVISPDQRLYEIDGLPPEFQPVKPVTYSVIKSGLVGLTLYLSTYWRSQGIRCNALSPGGIFNGQSPEFVKKLTDLIPMGRMAEIDEYRATIQFMCSDASEYLNGQNIVVDGGRSAW
jgi:NAD(P)-dependent dehydrogenase (short-subunit alcohol dehydrogenase family)